ncbi:hypothetical protein VTN77DRAFT_4436 [Rasamsonia byssochlamydoides]|uniref:uncharacterized protein n=1 Tax=Rasamsonia byssochlamydoides TaxID=89139 RepID=UPI0037435A06
MDALGRHRLDVALPGQPGQPSRGGGPRACRTCAVAKAKCIPSGVDRSKCERCSRLKKECVVQEQKVRRKRNAAPRQTRVAQLEQKLDDIVNLLKSSHDASSEDRSSKPSNPAYSAPSSTPSTTQTPSAVPFCRPLQEECLGEEVAAPISGPVAPKTQGHLQDGAHLQNGAISHISPKSDQDTYLSIFKTSMARHFPFVVIDDHHSAEELRLTKPFLLEVVLVAACYKGSGRQTVLGKEIIEHLSRRMLFEGEKSLDLLQGLLVYIAWYLNLFYTGLQMTNLLQLAIALVADLGLNRPLPTPGRRTAADVLRTALHGSKGARTVRGTLEERRTFLGCFYLSSMLSAHLKGLEPLPYTPYVEECCQVLVDAKEYPGDVYLVQLVRVQRIVNMIGQHVPTDTADLCKLRAPFGMHIASIQNILLMHCYSAEMLLYEFAIYDSLSWPEGGGWCANDPFQRVEALYACLEATLAVMNAFFTIQPKDYLNIHMVPWLQVGHCMVAMRRLSFLDIPGWDLKHVRSKLDMPGILDQIIKNTTEARQAAGRSRSGGSIDQNYVPDRDDVLAELSRKLIRVKQSFSEALRLEEERQASTQMQGQQPLPLAGEMWTGGETLLNMDEDFWQGFWQEWQFV